MTDEAVIAINGEPGQIADKAALLSGEAFGLVDFPVPGFGVIKVKPLSRDQAMAVHGREMSAAQVEQVLVSQACVKPSFTPGEVAQLQKATTAGGWLFDLVQLILKISGMEIGAGKAAYKQFRGAAG